MIQYGIFDENGRPVSEFETIEAGLEALRAMNDGEIHAYSGGYEGYYSDHYDLERGLLSRVCKGRTVLCLKEDVSPESLSHEYLYMLLDQTPPCEFEELLVTLDSNKAYALYESFPTPPRVWNAETRELSIEFYCFETEDTLDGYVELYYKFEL